MAVDILKLLEQDQTGKRPSLLDRLQGGVIEPPPPPPAKGLIGETIEEFKVLPQTIGEIASSLSGDIAGGWAGLATAPAVELTRFLAPEFSEKHPFLAQGGMAAAEDVLDFVRERTTAWPLPEPGERAMRQVEAVAKPFEWLHKGADWVGGKVEQGLIGAGMNPQDAAMLAATVAIGLEGAGIVLGPKIAKTGIAATKGGYNISKSSALKLKRKINRATRTGDFSDPGLIKTAQDILDQAKQDPAMMADIDAYMRGRGGGGPPPGPSDMNIAYRDAIADFESRYGRSPADYELRAIISEVDKAAKPPGVEPISVSPEGPTPPLEGAPPSRLASPKGYAIRPGESVIPAPSTGRIPVAGGAVGRTVPPSARVGRPTLEGRTPALPTEYISDLLDAGYDAFEISQMPVAERLRAYKDAKAGRGPAPPTEPPTTRPQRVPYKNVKSELREVFDAIDMPEQTRGRLRRARKFDIHEQNVQRGELIDIPATWHDGAFRYTAAKHPDGTIEMGRSGSYDTIMMEGRVAGAKRGEIPPGSTLYVIDLGPGDVRTVRIYRAPELLKEQVEVTLQLGEGKKPIKYTTPPQVTPESQATRFKLDYEGVGEGEIGKLTHEFYDPQTKSRFYANTPESVGVELEAHRARVADQLRKFEGVTIEDHARKVQRWYEQGEGDIAEIREGIREFTYERPTVDMETSADINYHVSRGEELLGIVDKYMREKGLVPEPGTAPVEEVGIGLRDGNISNPKGVTSNDALKYGEELRKESQLSREQIEAILEEEGVEGLRDRLPPKARDVLDSMKELEEFSLEGSEPRPIGDIMADIDRIFKKFRSEEGSIGVAPEEWRLTPEQRRALQRVVADAKRMVGDLTKYLEDLGLTPEQVAFIRSQIDEIRKVEPEAFGEVRQHWIDSRAIAAGDDIISQRKPAKGRQGLPVYRSEWEWTRRMKELGRAVNLKFGWSNPLRVIEWIDPEGTGLKQAYYDYRQSEQLYRREWKATKQEIKEAGKGVSYSSRKRIGAYAIAQQERGANILARMGVDVPRLTDLEMAKYNEIRGRFEALYERINTMREMIGKEPLSRVDNYFTFFRTFNMLERAGIKFNPLLDKASVIDHAYVSHRATPFRFGIERIKKGAIPVELDAFRVLESYTDTALRHLHLSPWIAKMNELISHPLPDPKTGKLTWRLVDSKPNTHHFLKAWVNQIAGRPAELSLGPKYDRLLTRLNKNIAYSVLGANARTAGIQVTALKNTWAEIGLKHTIDGILATVEDVMTVSGKNRRFALEHSKVLDGRAFDIAFEDAMKGIRGGGVGAAQDFLGRATLKPLQWMDMETAIASWNGAFKLAREKGFSMERAVNFADDVVTRTQGSSLAGDLAPIQWSAVGKALTAFQTFVINDWGFLTRDVLGIGNPKITSDVALKKAMRIVVATTLFNILLEDVMGVRSPFPTPIRDLRESLEVGDPAMQTVVKVTTGLVDPIPVYGSARYGKGIGGPLIELSGDIVKSYRGEAMAKPIPEVTSKLFGVPGVAQVGKSARAYKRGETPYGVIVGRYTRGKYEKSKRRNPLGGLKGLEGLQGL